MEREKGGTREGNVNERGDVTARVTASKSTPENLEEETHGWTRRKGHR